jgi:spoIIIJ-associated protein
MKKIKAKTLEEAYRIACDTFGCSITELRYEIVQYPRRGLLGLFSRPAVIVAVKAKSSTDAAVSTREPAERTSSADKNDNNKDGEDVSSSVPRKDTAKSENVNQVIGDEIFEKFFEEESAFPDPEIKDTKNEPVDPSVIQEEIESSLKSLIGASCFDIDVVEVDVIDDTAYIFLDGEDAALIIGKEGYRYNALSYLLYNWIHSRYQLYIKLEIARFLASQQEMIRNYIQPVVEHVRREGWGKTRVLDGILVQIALEQLRAEFPDKYVAIKRHRDGGRYILINEFNKRK